MDSVITNWLTHSPRSVPNVGEDLSCVDQWLNHGVPDLAPDFGEDEIARSVEEFTGQEFFNDSPLPFLLLEQQGNMPPVTGLSAPPRQYANQMGTTGTKARVRPALESVPECAPSPCAPLPIPPAADIPPPSLIGPDRVDSADSWPSAPSPAPGASPGASSAHFLSRSPSKADAVTAAYCAPASKAPAMQVPIDAAPSHVDGGTELVSGALRGGNTGGAVAGVLRHVPSTGTLSVLMNNTLSFIEREGTDESTQQQQQAHEGASMGVAVASAAPALPPSCALGSVSAGFLLQVAQPADMFGMAAHLYPSATPFSPAPYPLGFAMPLPPSNMLAGPVVDVGAEDAAAAAGASATCTAGMPAVSPGSAGAAVAIGVNGSKLRKSQSALELGAWRSTSLELRADAAEVAATGQKLIGRLTPEERMQRILRYRSKRNNRNFNREIKYQCRKTLADSRPRVGGRFARNDDPNSVMPHQTKKALRMKHQGTAGCDSKQGVDTPTTFDIQQLRQQRPQLRAAQPASSSTTTSSAAAQGVYVHLGVAPGAAPAATLQEPAGAGGGFGGAAPQLAAAAPSTQVNAESDSKAAGMAEAPYMMEAPQRMDSPSIDALWTHLEPGLDAVAGAACMAVDG
ncbi:hypothetical protein VOLCADRAFT_90708 [Volvox carteri f. nagariensis]|uniref:CCT domain-containing protein n=1 Tax=Volvox carteri f. nagariensis TaxID=3068 RepID=D8TVI4_VOLCA|nr:uncharacterized protein VOLCADRAFT_90708 [Volvox carteri f. nagariensis]EFJ48464.1 hypothetical protein VOLCADRAFT_90708 [Volvox carteri f. nagariensis]|eukprot:XP_002950263.1 hypothetical protein VOLCADRAFT_90708 [Volvox carteri f. nagariensis]